MQVHHVTIKDLSQAHWAAAPEYLIAPYAIIEIIVVIVNVTMVQFCIMPD